MDQIKVHSRRMQKSIDDNRNLFVGYITAGYPDEEHFFHIIHECCRRGNCRPTNVRCFRKK